MVVKEAEEGTNTLHQQTVVGQVQHEGIEVQLVKDGDDEVQQADPDQATIAHMPASSSGGNDPLQLCKDFHMDCIQVTYGKVSLPTQMLLPSWHPISRDLLGPSWSARTCGLSPHCWGVY